jgi:hypothetical protein
MGRQPAPGCNRAEVSARRMKPSKKARAAPAALFAAGANAVNS